MRKAKKFLSIVLSLLNITTMVCGIPFSTFAAVTNNNSVGATSGTTGDCQWDIEGTVLTITGNGKMGPCYYNDTPWVNMGINKVIIADGVTEISSNAFSGCKNIVSISIPDSVTSIGSKAFAECESLVSISLPNNVTSIGYGQFSGCSKITSIYIPASVTWITSDAFCGCDSLAEIVIDPENQVYDSRNNCNAVIRTQYNQLITGCKNSVIPENIERIEQEAFRDCHNLTSITIPPSVTEIGSEVFRGCTKLESISIPDSITRIPDGMFMDCASLNNVTIPDNVWMIGSFAFRNCTGLTSITIPAAVDMFDHDVFSGCTSLESMTVDENNPYYDSRDNCNGIISTDSNTLIAGCKETVIPDSVTRIGQDAFMDCKSLKSITIPDSVTYIGWDAFNGCTGLENVLISDSVTELGYDAFYNCSSLTAIRIPKGVSKLYPNVFIGCTNLSVIEVDGNNTVYDSRDNCNAIISTQTNQLIVGCKNTIIPDSVVEIGGDAFYGCTALTAITVPYGVTKIGSRAFYDCTNLKSIAIDESVTSIENYAFYNCDKLSDIYYDGTESQWNSISIKANNQKLTNANKHYNNDNASISWDIDGSAFGTNNANSNLPSNVVEFNGHFYKAFFQTVTWKKAKSLCEEMGGHLATVTSKEEDDFVYGLIKSKGVVCWLGGTDEAVEGEWKWITGEEWSYYPAEYGFDNRSGKQHYLATGFNGKNFWDDQSNEQGFLCNSEGYICEWDKNDLCGMENTYSFRNLSKKIPLSYYFRMFGGNSAYAHFLHLVDNGTRGQCFGMSLTSIASSEYNYPPVKSYIDSYYLYDLKSPSIKSSITGISASDYIKYAHLFQYTPYALTMTVLNKVEASFDLTPLYQKIKEYVYQNGDPVMINIRGVLKGKTKPAGHTIRVLGIGEDNDYYAEIIIYDCNNPGEPCKLYLNKSNGKIISWEYEVKFNGIHNCMFGSDIYKSSISYQTLTKEFIAYFNSLVLNDINAFLNYDYEYLISLGSDSILSSNSMDDNIATCNDTKKVLPIYPVNTIEAESQNLYWVNSNGDFTFSSNNNTSNCRIASESSIVDVVIPELSIANISVESENENESENTVDLSLSGDKSFEIKYSNVIGEELKTVSLSGKGHEIVETAQTNDGVRMTGAESISVIHDETVYEDTVYQLNSENSTLIQNNAGAPVVLEDCNNDGTYETEIQPKLIGDVDRDGYVNINDVTTIQRYLAELDSLDEGQLLVANTNGDESVTIDDSTHIQNYLAEFFSSFLQADKELETDENEESENYLYLKNTNNWTNIKAHMWNDESEKDLVGTEMELVDNDVYRVQVPDDAMWIQFSGNNGTSQTAEMQIIDYGLIFEDESWKEYLDNSN